MSGINKAIVLGNLGKDPEIRYTAEGKAIANLTIATSESWTGKDGEKNEKVEWHRVVFFGKLAEVCGEYLHKGSKIYVHGKIRTRKWTDGKTGIDRYATEIHGDEMQMLDSRGGDKDQTKATTKSKNSQPIKEEEFFDDDIPF